jgi:hypothetical protein
MCETHRDRKRDLSERGAVQDFPIKCDLPGATFCAADKQDFQTAIHFRARWSGRRRGRSSLLAGPSGPGLSRRKNCSLYGARRLRSTQAGNCNVQQRKRSILHLISGSLMPNAQYDPAERTRYRPDIDGLRAIAVISVVFYHYKVAPFAGGFVGVDVFFVISGYLITSLIYGEMLEGNFSIIIQANCTNNI